MGTIDQSTEPSYTDNMVSYALIAVALLPLALGGMVMDKDMMQRMYAMQNMHNMQYMQGMQGMQGMVQMNGMMQVMPNQMMHQNNYNMHGMESEESKESSESEDSRRGGGTRQRHGRPVVGHDQQGGHGGLHEVVRGAQDADEGAGGGPEAAEADHPRGRGEEARAQPREDDEGG